MTIKSYQTLLREAQLKRKENEKTNFDKERFLEACKKEQKRVAELYKEINSIEHSGKPGTFCPKLISLYSEMQELYAKQESHNSSKGDVVT